METPTLPKPITKNYSSSVDTSRPFRSVKEAVAIFGERILVEEVYSPKPYYTPPEDETSWRFSSPSPVVNPPEEDEQNSEFLGSLRKLEAELEETKAELRILKERESDTEIALASLNAELHKNMSKTAEAEADAARKAAGATRTASFEREKTEDVVREEEERRDLLFRMESSPTLAQILSLGDATGYFRGGKGKKMVKKKKPIVPLVGDLFFKKKGLSDALNDPLCASPRMYFN